jgi:RNA polymerase sigma factor (sigma-70 family)
MAASQISGVIQHLRRTVLQRDGAGLTDGQLLTEYLSSRDEAALAALVRRHGSMVWGVCRRVLRNHHDAEDAFQATFLVFVRKAASIATRELVANWLYGVALQTALKARATAAKRKERERQVMEMPEPAVTEDALWRDFQPLLDEELSRLPDKYRAVIVLCDLEGKTRKEAAGQLGVPEGTVGGWLARARAMLAKRLTQRGVALSGGALAAVLSHKVASAGVPTSVVCSTIKAATLFAAGQAAAAGAISVTVAALTEGVLKTMLVTKLKTLSVVLMVAVVGMMALGVGATALIAEPPEAKQADRDTPKQKDDTMNGNKARTVLTPEEAIKQMPKEQVTVEFTVKRAAISPNPAFVPEGGEVDDIWLEYGDRFYVTLARKAVTHVKRLGIEPSVFFRDKLIRVTGRIWPEQEAAGKDTRYRIWIDSLDQLEVVK